MWLVGWSVSRSIGRSDGRSVGWFDLPDAALAFARVASVLGLDSSPQAISHAAIPGITNTNTHEFEVENRLLVLSHRRIGIMLSVVDSCVCVCVCVFVKFS